MVKSVSCLGSEWRIEIAGVFFWTKMMSQQFFVWVISSWAIWVDDLCPVFCEEWDMAHVQPALRQHYQPAWSNNMVDGQSSFQFLTRWDSPQIHVIIFNILTLEESTWPTPKLSPNKNTWHWLCSNEWDVRNLKNITDFGKLPGQSSKTSYNVGPYDQCKWGEISPINGFKQNGQLGNWLWPLSHRIHGTGIYLLIYPKIQPFM